MVRLSVFSASGKAFSGQKTVWPEVIVSEGVVRQAVGNAAAEVRRPSRPAIRIGELSLPAQPGLDVDIAATGRHILAQVASGQSGTVSLQTYSTAPPESATADSPRDSSGRRLVDFGRRTGRHKAVSRLLSRSVLRHEPSGTAFALDAAQLQKIMPGGDPSFLNEEALRFVVDGWAKQVSFPAQGRPTAL